MQYLLKSPFAKLTTKICPSIFNINIASWKGTMMSAQLNECNVQYISLPQYCPVLDISGPIAEGSESFNLILSWKIIFFVCAWRLRPTTDARGSFNSFCTSPCRIVAMIFSNPYRETSSASIPKRPKSYWRFSTILLKKTEPHRCLLLRLLDEVRRSNVSWR